MILEIGPWADGANGFHDIELSSEMGKGSIKGEIGALPNISQDWSRDHRG
jgi:hypothetical protein